MRDRLVEKLENANYPVADLAIIELSDDFPEIVATLVSTAVDPQRAQCSRP
jgi:putative Mg2+ transporter-C (MgtC) family protein